MEIKRGENESKFDYIKRVTNGKRDKTLDIDYCEWSLLVYGQEYSSDVARRMFYGVERLLQVFDEEVEITSKNTLSEDDFLKELDLKKLEIEKERKKLQATKLEMNRKITHDARFELFYENVKEAFTALPVPQFNPVKKSYGNREYVVGMSDLHYSANFSSINNTYSIEECERRIEVLLWKIIDEVNKENITKIKVLNLADSIQGILRISDLKINEVSVVDAVVGVSKLIASFLNELSKYCFVEYLHVSGANHSQTRPLGSKASELAGEDLEKIIVNYVHDALQFNERVKVHITSNSDRIIFKIFDFDCIALHGHQIKNIKNSLRDLSQLHKKFFTYTFLGHFHGGQSMFVGESDVNEEVICVPSIVGSDPYSDSLCVGSKSMAQMYVFDDVEGHIETKNFILN